MRSLAIATGSPMATARRRRPFRASTVRRRRKPAGSSIEPNPKVEGAHIGFLRSWAGTVNGVQRAEWPTIRKLIVSEQKRLGTRTDAFRRDQLPKSLPKINRLVASMVADYTAKVAADEAKSEKRTEGIESALESTSSTAWADNIESLVNLTPGLGTDQKSSISDFLIGEEPGIPRSVRRSWIREQLGLISGKPITPVKVAGKLIETISGRSMKRLRSIVTKGILRGTRVESVMDQLAGLPGMTTRHAELLARDQIVKQNGRMTRIRHEGIAVTHYSWQTVGDERVRKTHRAFNNKRFSYKKGAGPSGVNPGEEIQCRCWASPDLLGAVRNLRERRARGDALLARPRMLPGRVRRHRPTASIQVLDAAAVPNTSARSDATRGWPGRASVVR